MADAIDVLLGLVPVAFGFSLGYLVKPAEDWLSSRRLRKRLAAVLASEVAAIRGMAAESIRINGPSVRETEEQMGKGGPQVGAVGIDDVDYPAVVFGSSLGQLQILGKDVMLKLTELYRWIAYAQHAKSKNQRYCDEFEELSKGIAARGGMTEGERQVLSYKTLGSVVFGTQYLRDQGKILDLAGDAVKDLERIGKTQVTGAVSVSTGEVIRRGTK